MIKAELTFRGREAEAKLQATAWKNLVRAVVFFHTQLLLALNVSNPRPYRTPSLPGEPPRKRTGWGQRHVLYELDEAGRSARVGVSVNAAYMAMLDQGTRHIRPRPWLFATLKKVWGRLQEIAGGK